MSLSVISGIALVIAGYLIGSIPTAYLAGKWIKGIDLRQYGSGTVSGSMVWEHVAHWAVVPVGLFDIFKGAIACWLGMRLGGGLFVAVLAGLAAVVGHNWPVFLHFTGGRGLSPFMGMMLVIFPWGTVCLLAALAIGYLLGDSAPWALTSLIIIPLLNRWLGGDSIIGWASIAMLLVTLAKRLEANGRPLPEEGAARRKMVLLRLFFDRDISSHVDWIRRAPEKH